MGEASQSISTKLQGKADLHIHTSASDGLLDALELLDYVEEHTDLDVIAITDHDHIRGAWRAREIWANRRYRFDLIVGIEVTAIEGHVAALFVEDPIDSLMHVEETLGACHKQGGLSIIPHPMSWATRSLDRGTILRVTRERRDGVYFDAIETATASALGRLWAHRASRLNEERLGLPEVGGSDSHFAASVGCAYTRFNGRRAEDLRASILAGETTSAGDGYPTILELGVGPVVRQTWRGLSTTPRTMGLGRTAWSFCQRIFRIR